MKRRGFRKIGLFSSLPAAASLLLAFGILSACGGASGVGAPTAGGNHLNVSYISTGTSSLALFISQDRGYFTGEGLDISTESFAHAAFSEAAAGEVDIIATDHASALQASQGGLPLVLLCEVTRLAPGIHKFVARSDSEITSPADLRGKRIGIGSVVGSSKLAVDALLQAGGLSSSDVTVTQIAYDGLGPALELGNVDVVSLPGQYLAAANLAQPLTEVADWTDLPDMAGLVQGGYYTTQRAYDADPDKFARFVKAFQRGSADAIADPALVKEYYAKIGKTTPELAAALSLPNLRAKTDPSDVQKLADMLFRAGQLKGPVVLGEGNLMLATISQ